MIGMMEMAAARAVDQTLPVGKLTVGTRIEVDHTLAVSVGTHVTASARLTEVKDRYLLFAVEARSGDILIGKGLVTRAIVDYARFAQIASKGEAAGHEKS
jgi:fluoroacetyl-CoA thioesterase